MTRKRIGWGGGVWLIYGAFVVFILGCVAFASMQRFDLVAPDYYARQIDYQTQIDKTNRTAMLPRQPRVEYRDRRLSVIFPGIFDPVQTDGTVRLFRPSNSSWDRAVPIALDSLGQQIIPGDNLIGGLWKVKVDWQANGESYYFEQSIVIE
jgi:hypothetical protein